MPLTTLQGGTECTVFAGRWWLQRHGGRPGWSKLDVTIDSKSSVNWLGERILRQNSSNQFMDKTAPTNSWRIWTTLGVGFNQNPIHWLLILPTKTWCSWNGTLILAIYFLSASDSASSFSSTLHIGFKRKNRQTTCPSIFHPTLGWWKCWMGKLVVVSIETKFSWLQLMVKLPWDVFFSKRMIHGEVSTLRGRHDLFGLSIEDQIKIYLGSKKNLFRIIFFYLGSKKN